jgi:DNA-binding NarL/FixJ family response regulator
MTTKVVLVDDHRMFREGLRALLSRVEDVEVVGEAENGQEALAIIEKLRPDLVLMDIAMAGLNGVDATRAIRRQFPDCAVLAVSMHADRHYVVNMLQAGAAGYLLKDNAFAELKQAIETVKAKRAYLSPQIAKTVVDDYMGAARGQRGAANASLTPHERVVLQLISEGRSTKDIASRLGVSVKTIESHRKHIMDKLSLYSVAELTKYAVREGLTSI